MRWLVCGGRDYHEQAAVFTDLDGFAEDFPPSIVIHGGAVGADALAGEWAFQRGIHVAEVRPNWQKYGKRAGYLRNMAMLVLQPEIVICFPGGKGTAMMAELAKKAGIRTFEL